LLQGSCKDVLANITHWLFTTGDFKIHVSDDIQTHISTHIDRATQCTAPQILPALSFSTAASSFPNEETTFVLPIASTTRRWVSKRYCLFFLGDIRVADNLQRAGHDRAD